MRNGWRLAWVSLALAAVGCVASPPLQVPADEAPTRTLLQAQELDMAPSGHGVGDPAKPRPPRAGANKASGGNAMYYHGGPVFTAAPHVYVIWYGTWAHDPALTILPAFMAALGGSPYYAINTTYTDGAGHHVPNAVLYGGSTTDAYSQGKTLSDGSVKTIVAAAIARNAFPADAGASYMVLTSPDVAESSGFCTTYCGWHTHATIAGKDLKYAFIGSPARCPGGCEAQTTGPNGDAAADAMANIIAHELEETATDPDLNAWYDRRGQENADKGAWQFGTTSTATNGARYNMVLGGAPYLIQGNWVNVGAGYVAWQYP